jgi:hypothetical protein
VTRLRPLTEAECYARCYGLRDDKVAVIRVERPRRHRASTVSGESLRKLFEERLDARDPGELAEPEAA